MQGRLNSMMVSPHFRQLVSLLLTLLLCCAPSPAQSSAPAQSSPPETAPNEAQLMMAPRPNPKYAKKLSELADKELANGHFDEALNYYQQAARYAPQDTALIERIASMRSKLVRDHVEAAERDALAGHADVATEELAKALLIDPGNTIVAERLNQMNAMKDEPFAKPDRKIEGLPELKPVGRKQDVNVHGDTKTVYEQLGQLFGIKIVFDPELAARTVRLHADNVDFTTALKVLSAETGTFSRPLTSTLLFVAQDTLEKRRQYAAEAEQTFALPESVGTEEMTELVRVLREMTGATRVQLNSQSHALSIRDTPERLALAGEIIRQSEKARGEILLEIEILEVDRNKARTLGLLPPSSAELISLTPSLISQLRQAKDISTLVTLLASIFGNGSNSGRAGSSLNLSSLIPPLTVVGGGKTTFLLTLPAIAAQFSDALTLVHSGRQILLRAQDGKPASFFVGDRFPITLSLLSGSLGASSFVPGPTNSILPSTSYNVGRGPIALTAADFRNVGQLDIAVVNEIDNSLTILVNQGAGTFLAGSPIPLGTTTPRTVPAIAPSIVSATLTTSGFHDLLVTDPVTDTVEVLLSNGSNGGDMFTPPLRIPVGHQPSAIVTGDFNADGNQDFAVTNFGDNTFSLFLGKGDGTFNEAAHSPFALPSPAAGPIAMTAVDFDSDGHLDLAIVNQTTSDVSILLGNVDSKGNPTFTQATSAQGGSPIAVGKSPVAIATGDLNNDSHPDLVVVNQADNTVSVLLGKGDGTFAAATNPTLPTGQAPTAVTISDFNADGNPDIAVTDPQTDSVSVFLGVGQGLFAQAFELPVGSNPTAILSAALSGASLPDVAVADDPSGATGQVTVILSPASLFSNSGAGIAQQPYPGAQYEDLGVKIKTIPTIHPNDEVTLQLEFEIRALAGSSINGIPIITNRTLSQTVRIREDEPTIIGGLLDNEETRTLTGLPGFAHLPGAAGYFFGQRTTTAQDTEMVILITPHKLRLSDRVSRSIYVGHDSSAARGSPAVPLPPQRQPE
jgi:Flp pilus assembly secretin CpaC